jgi:capsular exopolysaccharide synthesis family protein
VPSPVTGGIDPFRVLRRHMGLIVGSALLGLAIGVAGYILLDQFYSLYRGEVLFEIRPGLEDSEQIGARDIAADTLVLRLAQTETVLLTSREVLEAAVRNPDTLSTEWFQTYFIDEKGTQRIDDAVDELEEDLRSNVVRSTNLFALSWRAGAAADVPVVLNTIADAYMVRRNNIDLATFNSNLDLFRDQLNETHRQIEDLEQQIAAHIRDHGMLTLEDPKSSQMRYRMDLATDQLTEVNSSLSIARTAYSQTAAKLEGTIEPTFDDILAAERDPAVQNHLAFVLSLKTELRHLQDTYWPNHASMRAIESRLRAGELDRDAKLEEIMNRDLQAQLKDLADQVESYTEVIEQLEAEYEADETALRDLAAAQSEYQNMEARLEYLEVQRDSEMQLLKEVQLMKVRDDARRVRIAQRALRPREPSFPKPEVIIPLGMFLLVGLTVGLIFLRELTDRRIRGASDLAVIPGGSVIGVIPDLEDDPTGSKAAELVVRRHPQSVLAESYRQAWTGLVKAIDQAGHRSLLLVGCLPGAGTTTVATNVALAAAAGGKRVLVVDANFRRPRLAEAMGVANDGPGFGDLLVNAASLDDAIVESEHGIGVIPAGTPANRVFERLNNHRLENLMAELRGRYDLTIYDVPPAVVAGESMVLAGEVDAAMLVVRAHQEKRGLVARLINQLDDARCQLMGVLLNRPRGTAGGYFKKNFATMAEYAENDK